MTHRLTRIALSLALLLSLHAGQPKRDATSATFNMTTTETIR